MSFRIKMVDKVFDVNPLTPALIRFCKEYLTEELPDFLLKLTSEDLERERLLATRNVSEAYLERLVLCRKIAEELLDCNTLLFHGSCIAINGMGYIFAAASGVGKSTHARLWREVIDSQAIMINDDKPFLRVTSEGVVAYGSPWDGNHHLSTNISVPVGGICLLKRDEFNHIEQVTAEDAFPFLLAQTYRPKSMGAMEKILALVEQMGRKTKLYSLGCNMEPEAARISYAKMCDTVF